MHLTQLPYHRLKSKIREQDEFGQKITFTHNGDTCYKTVYGGAASLILKLGILAVAILLTTIVFQRNKTVKMNTKIVTDLYSDTTKHFIGQGTFAFAVSVLNKEEDITDSFNDYLDISFYSVTYLKNQSGSQYNYTQISLVKCNNTLPYIDQKYYEKSDYTNYYCPARNDYYISSNYNSPIFQTVEIGIYKCDSSKNPNCKSDKEIQNFINSHIIDLAVIYSYFDFDDFDNPVKTYLGDYDIYTIEDLRAKNVRYPVKYNQISTDDNYFFGGFFDTSSSFYSVGKAIVQSENYYYFGECLLSVEFYLDQEIDYYQRSMFTLFDMTGLVGGIYTIFSLLSAFLLNYFAHRSLMCSLLSKLYLCETKVNQNESNFISNYSNLSKLNTILPKPSSNELSAISKNNKNEEDFEEIKSSINIHHQTYEDNKSFDFYHQAQINFEHENSENISKNQLLINSDHVKKLIFDKIKAKRKFVPSLKDSLGCLICCRKQSSKSCKSLNNIVNLNNQYQDALNKFAQETDCISIIKSIRDLKLLVECTLSENKRIIAEFSRQTTVSESAASQLSAYKNRQGSFSQDSVSIPYKKCSITEAKLYEERISNLIGRLTFDEQQFASSYI